jgi:hypothetical protein
MACLLSLPDDVLKIIMQKLPLTDRLGRCSLVSQRLHAAAVAAMERLVLDSQNCYCIKGGLHGVRPRDKTFAVQWVCNHGQHLTSLEFWSWPLLLRELPCPNLLELEIVRGRVQLGPTADGYPGVMQDCTKLTHLKLSCEFSDEPEDGLIDLSSMVHLQHLVVSPEDGKGLSVATLPRLQHLTHLYVFHISTDNLLQLSCLTNLQFLDLTAVSDAAGRPFSISDMVLPASLKQLELREWMDAGVLSVVPTGLQDLQFMCSSVDLAEGPCLWLSSLGRLQQLTRLEVIPQMAITSPQLDWPAVGPVYSALTASSNLVCLEINDHSGYSCPDGIWQYVFPASRKPPHLTRVDLFEVVDAPHSCMCVPSWRAADLSRLVSCCPGLCDLATLPLQLEGSVSELHKLSALTRLVMFYDPINTDSDNSDDDFDNSDDIMNFQECVGGLAVVTQVRHLELKRVSQAITPGSLLPLTRLTALTELAINWVPDVNSEGDAVNDGEFVWFRRKVRQPALSVAWDMLLCLLVIDLASAYD